MGDIISSQFPNDIDPRSLARALGGEVRGNEIRAPGPGHSKEDRSLSVKVTPGDLIVYSHAGDDWQECKDYVREKAGLGAFKPNSQSAKPRSSTGPKGPREVDTAFDYTDD